MRARKIQSWAEAGIISAEQGRAIQEFEKQQSRPVGLMVTVGLGVLIIALGVISVIAANWMTISDGVKIFAFFAIWIPMGCGVIPLEKSRPVVAEGLRALFFLFTLAGIGLIAQIYNLVSDGWSAFAFWISICLPMVALARNTLLPGLWWGMYILTTILWFRNNLTDANDEFMVCSLAALLLVPGLLGPVFTGLQVSFLEQFRPPTRFFSLIFLWGIFPLILDSGANYEDPSLPEARASVAMVLLAVGIAHALIIYAGSRRRDGRSLWQTASLLVPLVLGAVQAAEPGRFLTGETGGAFQFLLILVLASFATYHTGMIRVFNLLTLAIALRMIVVYFQIFGSLLAQGFGMIISGLVILGVAWGWHRFRKSFGRLPKQGGTP